MKAKTIILSLFVITLLLSGFIYLFFNGNPITKEKSRESVTTFFEENYPEESFRITDIAYYPGEGTYIFHIVSKDGDIEGNIDVRDGKIIMEGVEFPFKE
jgi:hypothetical protein